MKLTDKFKILPGIYVIENRINGKIYVGETINIHKRISEHRTQNDLVIHAALKKHGLENFKVYIIYCPSSTKLERLDLEEKLIKNFDCLVPKGYNICSRGRGVTGLKHSEESKEKMKNSQKRIAKFGAKNPLSKPVFVYSLDGVFIKCYAGRAEAARQLGVSRTDIICTIKGRSLQCSDLIFKEKHMGKNIPPLLNENKRLRRRAIGRYDLTGNLLEKYSSVSVAAKLLKITRTAITSACGKKPKRSEFRTCGGFRWKYLN